MGSWILKSKGGASWTIERLPAIIGREGVPGLGAALSDPRVSRRHAEIFLDDEARLSARDLDSRNGTYLNGVRLRADMPISPGDVLRVGSTELRLTYSEGQSATARCDLAAEFGSLEDSETRAIPFDALTRRVAEAGTKGSQQKARVGTSAGVLYELARSVAGLRDVGELVDAAVAVTADLLGGEHVAIYEPDEDGLLAPASGAPGGRAGELRPDAPATSLIWRAMRLREAVMFDARRGGPHRSMSSASLQNLHIRSAIAMPLCVGNETTGVLYADTRQGQDPLDETALELMGAIALQAAASLQATRHHLEALETQAELDVANKRLREWGCDLERRVRERTLEIADKKREIETLLADKDDLLRMVAHDLRMPLTSVVGYAQIAEHDLDAGDLDAVRERIETILDVGRRSAYLLDDLLTAESIRSGTLAVEARAVRVDDLLRRTASTVEVEATDRGVAVAVVSGSDLPVAMLDPGRVSQILDNLTTNAVKALTRGGRVEIGARRDGSDLVLEVRDDGPGLDEATTARILGRSSRRLEAGRSGDSSRRGRRGAGFGLGLAIARKLTTLLGGELDVTTASDVGTTFAVRLPGAFDAGNAASREKRTG